MDRRPMAFPRNPNYQQMPNGKLPTSTFLEGRYFTTKAVFIASLSLAFGIAARILAPPCFHVSLDVLRT